MAVRIYAVTMLITVFLKCRHWPKSSETIGGTKECEYTLFAHWFWRGVGVITVVTVTTAVAMYAIITVIAFDQSKT